MSGLATCPYTLPPSKKKKSMVKGRERRFITQLEIHCGKEQSKQSARLWGSDMSYRFK
jgi:hypothetical protein